jgi:hypothetical protein
MTKTIDCPVSGLDVEYPETLCILPHPASNKFFCYCFQGTHGLASFTTVDAAVSFVRDHRITGVIVLVLSFDSARQVAKERPAPIESLMILDDIADPIIHYVQ